MTLFLCQNNVPILIRFKLLYSLQMIEGAQKLLEAQIYESHPYNCPASTINPLRFTPEVRIRTYHINRIRIRGNRWV